MVTSAIEIASASRLSGHAAIVFSVSGVTPPPSVMPISTNRPRANAIGEIHGPPENAEPGNRHDRARHPSGRNAGEAEHRAADDRREHGLRETAKPHDGFGAGERHRIGRSMPVAARPTSNVRIASKPCRLQRDRRDLQARRPSVSTMRTRSAAFLAPSFSMMRARCTSMVRGEMPSSRPACLLESRRRSGRARRARAR